MAFFFTSGICKLLLFHDDAKQFLISLDRVGRLRSALGQNRAAEVAPAGVDTRSRAPGDIRFQRIADHKYLFPVFNAQCIEGRIEYFAGGLCRAYPAGYEHAVKKAAQALLFQTARLHFFNAVGNNSQRGHFRQFLQRFLSARERICALR